MELRVPPKAASDIQPQRQERDGKDEKMDILADSDVPPTSGVRYSDELGRPRVSTPKSGPAFLFVRCPKFQPVTAMTHQRDMSVALDSILRGRRMLFISSDNGADYSVKSDKTLMSAYETFRSRKLLWLAMAANARTIEILCAYVTLMCSWFQRLQFH
jgi:hypothetical protein